jgi:hypothetical protein
LAIPAILTFFVAAVIVGQGVDFHRRARARAEDLVERRSRELREARKEVELHRTAREDLQSRFVGESVTLNTVYAHARALGDLSEKAVPGALLELLAKFTGMEQGSVYLREGDWLVLAAEHGVAAVDVPAPVRIGLRTGLAGLAFTEGRDVSFHENPTLAATGAGPVDILAAPLPGLPGEKPLGVALIRRIPFNRLNPATRRHVAMVCDWAAASLRQARNWSESRERMVDDPDLRIATAGYLQRRLEEEFHRARRYHLDLAVVLVRFAGGAAAHPERLGAAIAAAVSSVRPVLRNTDILGKTRRDDTLVVILVATPRDHVPVVKGKIFNAGSPAPESGLALLMGSASLSAHDLSAESLLARAEAEIADQERGA